MKRKKRSGAKLALLLLTCILPTTAAAKKKALPEGYSLVAGTVFSESGYAVAAAGVMLIPDPQTSGTPVKVKKLQAESDARGEFVFRVPMASMHYVIKVSAKGYQPAQKPVDVQGEERVDVTFQLQPESK